MNAYGNIMMGRGVAKALGITDVQLDETEKAWRSVSWHRVRLGELKLSIDEIEKLSAAAKAEGTDIRGRAELSNSCATPPKQGRTNC